MKNKLIIGSILTIITFLITLSFVRVTAYSGELDPKNYITLPSEIRVQNRKGTGKIELSTSASGYSVSYQKIDITTMIMIQTGRIGRNLFYLENRRKK